MADSAAKTIADYFRSKRGKDDEDEDEKEHKEAKNGALASILSKSLASRYGKRKGK